MIFKWLGKLFGGEKPLPMSMRELTPEEMAVIAPLIRPAIRLARGGNGLSRVGGLPNLPAGIDWPRDGAEPLTFLCQIACAELPPLAAEQGLPATGILFFFFVAHQDITMAKWGKATEWRVIHAADASAADPERALPPELSIAPFKHYPVTFTVIDTYPDSLHPALEELMEDDAVYDAYGRLNVFPPEPGQRHAVDHHIGGYPDAVQNADMEERCSALAAGEWKLLLQLDTDDSVGMQWWDAGRLYFWIREDDLKARRFDQTWLILQSC